MSTLPAVEVERTMEAARMPSTPGVSPTFAVCLPSMTADALTGMVRHLRQSLPDERLLIASPDLSEEATGEDATVLLVPYPVHRPGSDWVLNAADYLAAARLAEERNLAGLLLLGTDAGAFDIEAVAALRRLLLEGVDVAVPRYNVRVDEGLANSALLYPLTRALFNANIRFPLPLDCALSRRMLQRLAPHASRVAGADEHALVWPVAEASVAGFSLREVEGVDRPLPRPQQTDLNAMLATVCGSLFSDIEAKAANWQRPRTPVAGRMDRDSAGAGESIDEGEIRSLVEGFRLAFSNLREIWSLVLPPQSLLALKKLSASPVEAFRFPPNLWARVVYDFAVAYHLRTLNRGHLLGSMTPLYLAWVAGLLHTSADPGAALALLHDTASAFEQEKPYFVSRWRWPDRFNP